MPRANMDDLRSAQIPLPPSDSSRSDSPSAVCQSNPWLIDRCTIPITVGRDKPMLVAIWLLLKPRFRNLSTSL